MHDPVTVPAARSSSSSRSSAGKEGPAASSCPRHPLAVLVLQRVGGFPRPHQPPRRSSPPPPQRNRNRRPRGRGRTPGNSRTRPSPRPPPGSSPGGMRTATDASTSSTAPGGSGSLPSTTRTRTRTGPEARRCPRTTGSTSHPALPIGGHSTRSGTSPRRCAWRAWSGSGRTARDHRATCTGSHGDRCGRHDGHGRLQGCG